MIWQENFNIVLIFIFFFGSLIGSFLNVVILRLPLDQSLSGRSHCPVCKHVLGPIDLLPIFSYIFLLGRCRYCRAKISPRYLIIEAITGLLFAWAWLYIEPVNGLSFIILAKYWLASAVLLVVFVIDLEHYLILDGVIFPAAIVVALLNLAQDFAAHNNIWSWQSNFVSGALGVMAAVLPFFLLWSLSRGKWLGFGDVKLAILLGMILGWPVVLVGIFWGIILGGIISVFLLALTEKNLKSKLPFGTFLAVGTIFALFYGEKFLHWYLGFLGF